jgi:hypothetical protein
MLLAKQWNGGLIMPELDTPIERKDTGIRILLSILFGVIVQVVETVLGIVVLFSLAFALITKRPPGDWVRRFANRTVSYLYHILRYLTYNESEPPFPFSDFPPELEPLAPMNSPTKEEKN